MTWDVSGQISRLRRGPNDIACDLVYADSANRWFNVPDEHGSQYTSCIRENLELLGLGSIKADHSLFFRQGDFKSMSSSAGFDKNLFTRPRCFFRRPNLRGPDRDADLLALQFPDVRLGQRKLLVRSRLSYDRGDNQREPEWRSPEVLHVIDHPIMSLTGLYRRGELARIDPSVCKMSPIKLKPAFDRKHAAVVSPLHSFFVLLKATKLVQWQFGG